MMGTQDRRIDLSGLPMEVIIDRLSETSRAELFIIKYRSEHSGECPSIRRTMEGACVSKGAVQRAFLVLDLHGHSEELPS
jgi:hypothetical protein